MHPPALSLLATALFAAPLCLAAVTDLQSLRIPNPIPLGLAALFPVAVVLTGGQPDWFAHVATAVIAFAAGCFLFSRGWLGGGDVKLLAAVTLWYGTNRLPDLLFAIALCGAVLSLVVLALRASGAAEWLPQWGALRRIATGRQVPYGIAIAAGALIALPALVP
jgi:prepilin peptidase CpaA